MKKIKLTFLSTFILLFSCKNEKTETVKEHKFEISFSFPDTVYINQGYDGKINYNNDLDTITTNFDDIKKARFLEYVFLITPKNEYKDDYLKKIVKDTFVAETNRIIPLYNLKFSKLGLNYIDGMITDEVIISNGAKNKNGEFMDRIITNEFRATKKVVVIEKPQLRKE